MVLDIAAFRPEEGGDAQKIRKLQTDRFKVFFLKKKAILKKSIQECRSRRQDCRCRRGVAKDAVHA